MKNVLLIAILGLGFCATSQAKQGTEISCSFKKSDLVISIQNFKSGTPTGSSPLFEASFVETGKKSIRKSMAGVAMSRGSWVADDLKDQRPTAIVDFENARLVIYYCSGNGKMVEAKFFTGFIDRQKVYSFVSSKVFIGTCSGENLKSVLTNDCSSFE